MNEFRYRQANSAVVHLHFSGLLNDILIYRCELSVFVYDLAIRRNAAALPQVADHIPMQA
jgi:hypothetical protein